MKKLIVIVVASLLVLLVFTAVASASTPSLAKLAKQVAAMQKKVKSQTAAIIALQNQLTAAKSVLQLAPYVSVTSGTLYGTNGPNIAFTGANLHVVDGSGATDDHGGTLTGLGNLIVGYDEEAGTTTGSHNIVCGQWNSFSSYGGLVAGATNTISGPYADVTGGFENTASDWYASVSGGAWSTASGTEASVSGGSGNIASGTRASVSGGSGITASDMYGWAGGGYHTP